MARIRGPADVTINASGGAVQVLDLMGNAFTDVKNAGDNVRFTLTDYPVYVVGAKIGIE